MILLRIDKKKTEPLFKQVYSQIIKLIENGSLNVGDVLPSTRKLAEQLGVHRTTVYRAYEELWSSGYIDSNIGGYSRIRERAKLVDNQHIKIKEAFKWETYYSNAASSLSEAQTLKSVNDQILDFRALSPDKDLMPVEDFRVCMNQILREDGQNILDYGPVAGYTPLREELAKMLGQHGITSSANEIILTNGIQNGLQLLMQLLCNRGDTIFIESPSYPRGIHLMKLMGIKIVEVPTNGFGIDLKAFEKLLNKHQPKALYTMPTFHNPLGISTSQIHREKLLALCIKYKVPLIEDAFEEEMKYFGKAVLPIKSMDSQNIVIYMGTFSKVLFPGIRVGWIVADKRLIDKLTALKQNNELAGSSVTQAAVYKFCEKGHYELHKKRLHRAYRKRMQSALSAGKKYLSKTLIHYTKPEGGYLLWFTLVKPQITEKQWIKLLQKNGVAVTPGNNHYATNSGKVQFRMSIAHRNELEIEEGIKRIADALAAMNNI